MDEVVYLNGSFVPRSEAKISPFDYGFLYGYGLFETMRAYHGNIFLLERHIKRLLDSAEEIGLGLKHSEADLCRDCLDTLRANGLEDARLRLTVSRGEVSAFPGTGIESVPTVLVSAKNYSPMSARIYEQGFKAIVSSLSRNSQSLLFRLKSANYLLSLLAKAEAEVAGFDEALLLNEKGFIAEGSVSNVFFVASGSLVTPSLNSGILPGIARELVIELARSLGIHVIEAEVRLTDLKQADEAFLTNSIMEIMPLVAVSDGAGEDIHIGSGKPGGLTRRLMAAYREMVERETSPK